MKIVFKKSLNWRLKQKYHSCIVAKNGKTLYTSENYYNLDDCESTAFLVQKDLINCKIEYKFDRHLID